MTTIAERIAARLEALGKNPSAVALEAGLGRSSVRDIMVGKVSSPRLDTLEKLTGPLECSLEYLTGNRGLTPIPPAEASSGSNFYDPMEVVGVTSAEIGVFRTDEATTPARDPSYIEILDPDGAPRIDSHLLYRDLRLPDHYFALYQLNDRSLEDIHIMKGDILTVAAPALDGIVPLKRGTLVVIRRKLSGQEINSPSATEVSVRYVDILDGDVTLVSRAKSLDYAPIRIADRPGSEDMERYAEEALPNYYWTGKEMVIVDGVVVRVTRTIFV